MHRASDLCQTGAQPASQSQNSLHRGFGRQNRAGTSSAGTTAISIARASMSASTGSQTPSVVLTARGGRICRTLISNARTEPAQFGKQRRQEHGGDAVGRADCETARGRSRIEWRGSGDNLRARARMSATGPANSMARSVGTTPFGVRKNRGSLSSRRRRPKP